MELLMYIGVIIVASGLVWKGGSMLESSSEILALHYHLPPVVRGGIIMAVGSSFPELSATILSIALHGKFDLGVSVVVGSAIFNILVIPGLSVVFSKRLNTDKILIYKDAQFYITSVAVLLLTFSLAVIYNPIKSEQIIGVVTRPIALIPILLYILYLFLQMQETRDFKETDNHDYKSNRILKEWFKLLISLVLIVGSVEGLVRSAIFLGDYFNTPDFLWGVTVIAAATSVPDAFVSIKVATQNKGVVSLSNVIGSNIFDLLVAVPIGILIAGSASINFSIAVPMMMFLTIATVLLITLLRWRLKLTAKEGWVLIVFYILFVCWMIMESLHILSFVID